MKNLAIVVNDLSASSDFNIAKIMMWLEPLKAERFGIIPIFECKTWEEFALVVNLYELENVVLSSNHLVMCVYSVPGADLNYTINTTTIVGRQTNLLLLPDNEDVEWLKLEPALDRFEELL